MTKSIFASKTFWFGLLQIVFAGVGYFTGWTDHQTSLSLLVTGAASIGIRTGTTQPVSLTGSTTTS